MKWTGERVMVLCVLSHSHASASMSIYRSSDPDSVAQVRHTKLFGRSMSMKLLFCLFDCFLPTERFKLSRCHHLSDRNALFKKKKKSAHRHRKSTSVRVTWAVFACSPAFSQIEAAWRAKPSVPWAVGGVALPRCQERPIRSVRSLPS